MPLTPEGRVKRDIKQYLKQQGIWYFMPQNVGLGSSGVPDFICCLPMFGGKLLGIEAKAPGKRSHTTALQDIQLAAIRTANGWAIVVDDVQQLEEFLDDCRAAAQGTRGQGHESGADTCLHSAS